MVGSARCSPASSPLVQRHFVIDNLLVRIHLVFEIIRWTGLAPWEFEFPFPDSLTSTFLRNHLKYWSYWIYWRHWMWASRSVELQEYLTHKNITPPPRTAIGPKHGPAVGSQGVALSYERGTPVPAPLDVDLEICGAIVAVGSIGKFEIQGYLAYKHQLPP